MRDQAQFGLRPAGWQRPLLQLYDHFAITVRGPFVYSSAANSPVTAIASPDILSLSPRAARPRSHRSRALSSNHQAVRLVANNVGSVDGCRPGEHVRGDDAIGRIEIDGVYNAVCGGPVQHVLDIVRVVTEAVPTSY